MPAPRGREWSAAVTTVASTTPVLLPTDLRTKVRADPAGADDGDLADFIAAATGMVEDMTGSRLLTQTVVLTRPDFRWHLPVPVGPVQSLTLGYFDATGTAQVVDPSIYTVIGAGTLRCAIALIPGNFWPAFQLREDAVTLTAVVGYGATPAAVPGPILQAIRLLVGDYFANREDTIAERGVVPATLPTGVLALLANKSVY